MENVYPWNLNLCSASTLENCDFKKIRESEGFWRKARTSTGIFLSGLELGKKGMTIDTLFRLSRALGVTPQSIISAIYEH